MSLDSPEQLNSTQQIFIDWNADRLGLSAEQSFVRFRDSWNRFEGGFGGGAYREFNVLAHDAFKVLHGDGPDEVMASYEVFAPLHFLRMLSYPEPTISAASFLVQQLGDRKSVSILDFGCGLAQQSRALASFLVDQGREVHLYLADIPTIRKGFLVYLCRRTGLNCTFLDCTASAPIPVIPAHCLCIATEFFEHVYDPVAYFNAINEQMDPGGLLVTNASNHNREFMHVTPNLEMLRKALQKAEFEPLKEARIFRKTCANLQ